MLIFRDVWNAPDSFAGDDAEEEVHLSNKDDNDVSNFYKSNASTKDILDVVLLHGEHRCGIVYGIGTEMVENSNYNSDCACAMMAFATGVLFHLLPSTPENNSAMMQPGGDAAMVLLKDSRLIQTLLFLADFTAKVDVTTLIPAAMAFDIQSG